MKKKKKLSLNKKTVNMLTKVENMRIVGGMMTAATVCIDTCDTYTNIISQGCTIMGQTPQCIGAPTTKCVTNTCAPTK